MIRNLRQFLSLVAIAAVMTIALATIQSASDVGRPIYCGTGRAASC